MKKPVRIEEVEPVKLDGLLERIKPSVSAEDYALLEKLVGSLLWLTRLVRERGTSLRRLRRLVGLSGSEKTAAVIDAKGSGGSEGPEDPDGTGGGGSGGERGAPQGNESRPGGAAAGATSPKAKVKGHGRLAASDYPHAVHIPVPHESLHVGGCCPGCAKGTLFALREPAQFLRIIGQAPLEALCWDCQRLRCSACGAVYTARAPEEACGDKYTETAVSMMALLRYGAGVPHTRLERLQENLNTPVPSSTQWEVVEKRVSAFEPVLGELVRQAAQGPVFFTDDTHTRILELMGKRRSAQLAAGTLDDPERTGLHTTAVVSTTADGRPIAVFFSGRKHAGENFSALLEKRSSQLPPPIAMSDALACNTPKGHKVVASCCLAHGRRNVVDEVEDFPDECRHFLEKIGLVFAVDEECRGKRLSPDERLKLHQLKSAPVMEELEGWMRTSLEHKLVEPNSGLGKAFNYLLKRWDKFTLFLRLPGAPLDNNAAERALKMAIRHRNNSLFFRSLHGAEVGDTYMSLIYTAELQGENPFEYLTALQRHSREACDKPADWLPWTWRDTLERTSASGAPGPLSQAARGRAATPAGITGRH